MSTILFTLSPITGHVRPALPVVRELVAAGHDVRVYTGSKFASAVLATGAGVEPMVAGRDLDDSLIDEWALAHGAPKPGVRRLQFDARHHFVETVPGFLEDVDAIVARHRPDVIVSDNAFIAGSIAGRRHGIPSVVFSVSPLPLTSRDTMPFGTGLMPPTTAGGRLVARGLRVLIEKVVFRSVQRRAHELVVAAGMPPQRGFFFDWSQTMATRVLQTSVPGLEYPRSDLPEKVETVGALLPRGVESFEEPTWWGDVRAARAAGRPVVLVTQGTIATDSRRLVRPALEGLADEDVLVVATTDDDSVAVPPNARVTPFVPFDRLLPFVDVMVTNGGFGGVQLALSHGVPLVVAGRTEDKAEVGARVEWSGAGVRARVDRDDVTSPRAVRESVRRLLTTPSFRARARELEAEYAQYDGIAGVARVVSDLAAARREVAVG
ncbi:glycosyltransferase [Cellulomonas edaphi]|uniref:Glycosyltransferase n=1 Tax=Cellulomonas edaphi TaxID=3053468 RepID=A0ABT7S768_9CELL|nr:nucleotide disphospho-sugar-binding domain-containing protein [Cellulomons edaphi]MDM7831464.1 glycosyltransferase [Cellulomons edaphi]